MSSYLGSERDDAECVLGCFEFGGSAWVFGKNRIHFAGYLLSCSVTARQGLPFGDEAGGVFPHFERNYFYAASHGIADLLLCPDTL